MKMMRLKCFKKAYMLKWIRSNLIEAGYFSTEYVDDEYLMRGILNARVTVEKETNISTKDDKQELMKLVELDDINIVYQVVYNK